MKEIIRKVGECDIELIISELKNKNVTSQFSLQGTNENDFDGAHGKSYDLRPDESEFIVPLYNDMPYIYSLIHEYNLSRTRIMKMIKGTCYAYHTDLTPRIHIPLTTNEQCFFVIDDTVIRMPADGSIYWVDTRLMHTAINANQTRFIRTHLVGNVNSDK